MIYVVSLSKHQKTTIWVIKTVKEKLILFCSLSEEKVLNSFKSKCCSSVDTSKHKNMLIRYVSYLENIVISLHHDKGDHRPSLDTIKHL